MSTATPARERAVAPGAVPASFVPLVAGYHWARDTVGQSGGAVHRLHAPGRPNLYLKHGAGAVGDAIIAEMARLCWLADHIPVAPLRGFVVDDDGAWLLTEALPGRTAWQWLAAEPEARGEVVALVTANLRRLHAIPLDTCPFDSGPALRLAAARRRVAAGAVDEDDFAEAHRGWSAEAVFERALALRPRRVDAVVTHGDYSLDNILIDGGRVTGMIDLDRVGVADRYQDVAILWDSLGEFGMPPQRRMLADYGIARLDRRRLDFHLCLDELF